MRIGVNVRVLLKDRMEGICRYTHETLSRMVINHLDDEFVLFFDRPYHEDFVYASNVTPVVIGPPARHPILWYWWFEISLSRAIKKHQVDVFLSPDTYMSLCSSVPTVLVTHDLAYIRYPEHIPFLTREYYKHYFPLFHQKSRRSIAVSEFTKSDMVRQYKISPDQITVAYNATPPGFTSLTSEEKILVRNKWSAGQKYFAYVGSIHPRKNVARTIKAFDLFRRKNEDNNFKLVIMGRMAWRTQEFENALDSSPFKSDIIHIQPNDLQLREILAASEGLIYVSLFEGFGIPVLEAMACDVPVITSKDSSMEEVVSDAALLVNPLDIDDIAGAMSTLLIEKPRLKLISKGRERVRVFDWSKSSDVIYQTLKKVYDEGQS